MDKQYVYKFRAIGDIDIKGRYGDSSRITKWSHDAGTIFLDRPASVKALQRQVSLARYYDERENKIIKVTCEIVKFELREVEIIK